MRRLLPPRPSLLPPPPPCRFNASGSVPDKLNTVTSVFADPVFAKLEAELAKAMMSLPASKGFEIGSGFRGASMTGRDHNDLFETDSSGKARTATNNSGGIQGGISNGEDVLLRVAFKPTATIASSQKTIDKEGNAIDLTARGRHDPCVLPRAVPMVEAMACLVICDALLRQAAIDIFPHIP